MNKIIDKLTSFYTKLSKREKVIFYVALFAAIATASDQLLIKNIAKEFSVLDIKIKDKELLIKQSLYVLEKKERILSEGKEYQAYSVGSKEPDQEKNDMIQEIQAMGKKTDVNISYTKPSSKEESVGQGKKYFATLECEAEMAGLASFFHSIESSSKLLKVEKFDIEPKSKESSIARCSMTISKTVLSDKAPTGKP